MASFPSLAACSAEASALNASLEVALSALQQATQQLAGPHGGEDDDPCGAHHEESYDVSLHIGAVFIILAVSLVGVLATMMGKHCPAIRLSAFAIALGRTAGEESCSSM